MELDAKIHRWLGCHLSLQKLCLQAVATIDERRERFLA